MTAEEAKRIIENEWDCINRTRNGRCSRECEKCDLVKPSTDILVAYDIAIDALEKQIPQKKHKYMGCRCICSKEVAKNQTYCEYCGQKLLEYKE